MAPHDFDGSCRLAVVEKIIPILDSDKLIDYKIETSDSNKRFNFFRRGEYSERSLVSFLSAIPEECFGWDNKGKALYFKGKDGSSYFVNFEKIDGIDIV